MNRELYLRRSRQLKDKQENKSEQENIKYNESEYIAINKSYDFEKINRLFNGVYDIYN